MFLESNKDFTTTSKVRLSELYVQLDGDTMCSGDEIGNGSPSEVYCAKTTRAPANTKAATPKNEKRHSISFLLTYSPTDTTKSGNKRFL